MNKLNTFSLLMVFICHFTLASNLDYNQQSLYSGQNNFKVFIDSEYLGGDSKQLKWVVDQLKNEGYRVSEIGSSILSVSGSEQQLLKLANYPYVLDIVPMIKHPFEPVNSITDNKQWTIIIPPTDHLDCDSFQTPADPNSYVDFTGQQISKTYDSKILQETYPGLIYLPSSNGREVSGKFPLAILIHGRHYDYNWYQEIQQHLARNGIASVAIQYSDDHNGQDYYEDAFLSHFEDHMNILFGNDSAQYNPAHNKFNGKISLVGHSMGGGFAVKAAQWLKDQTNNYDVQLMSVINLAPNPQYDDWFLTSNESQGFLTIFGSDDNDNGVNSPGSSGFLTYDRSGYVNNEYSFNGYWRNRFTKSFVYLDGANHNSFIDDDLNTNQGPHHNIILGYINSYLRWSLKNDYSQQAIFKQQHNFFGQSTNVSLQYSDGMYRRVIDHFQGPYSTWNAMGGRNKFYNILRQKGLAKMNGNLHKSVHETQVLQLEWDARDGNIPLVQFHLPMPFSFGTDYRNLSRLKYLSFRMGQLVDSVDSDQDLDFTIRLTSNLNGVTKNRHVSLSDVGRVPSPFAVGQNAQTKTTMNTVMIPLCVFEGIDYERVIKISFQFNHPARIRGKVQMDNLEFLY